MATRGAIIYRTAEGVKRQNAATERIRAQMPELPELPKPPVPARDPETRRMFDIERNAALLEAVADALESRGGDDG